MLVAVGFVAGYYTGLKRQILKRQCNWGGFIWQKATQAALRQLTPGVKVSALYPDISWHRKGETLEVCDEVPIPGRTYAIRQTRIMPNGNLGIQLIGVTVHDSQSSWEPFWNAAAFVPSNLVMLVE